MGLTEGQLAEDLTRAMKARDMPRVYVLRGLLTAVKHVKVERRGADLVEADLVQLVRREIRKREEAEEFAVRGGRADAVAQNRNERTRSRRPRGAAPSAPSCPRCARAIPGGSTAARRASLRAAFSPKLRRDGPTRSRPAQEGAGGAEARDHLPVAEGARGSARPRGSVRERRVRSGQGAAGLRALPHRAIRGTHPRAVDVQHRLDPA
ncbi:MAG: hypothetical protein E6J75_08710 [Deltaproteobacteria bacterium]|nr:MAG: hypothetical protein E6J75_08710 [Deltaproteobacteria bacterium]